MSDMIRTIDLTKRYRKVAALDGLNLDIPQGSVFGLVGPNGAGKTTAIKTIMNILEPDAGRAEVLGIDSRHIGPEQLARIGYVSENQEQPDWMTVGYLLSYLKPFYPTWDDARAEQLVRQFELPSDRKLRHLSRGMRMKAALASSLAYHPQLLVLDEPFSGLDPVVRDDLIEGIIESAEETTILVSSHDLAEIESFASHIAYLDNGRLRFAEEMSSLSARFREIEDHHRRRWIRAGHPACAARLAGSLAAPGFERRAHPLRRNALRRRADHQRNSSLFQRCPQHLGDSDAVARQLPDPGP